MKMWTKIKGVGGAGEQDVAGAVLVYSTGRIT